MNGLKNPTYIPREALPFIVRKLNCQIAEYWRTKFGIKKKLNFLTLVGQPVFLSVGVQTHEIEVVHMLVVYPAMPPRHSSIHRISATKNPTTHLKQTV
jgi:hypothetical protein